MTLQVRGLALARGDRTLFSGVDFELQAGQMLHLAGANGSGKSSLLRCLAGFSPALAGSLYWHGVPLDQQREDWQRGLIYVGHHSALKSELTAAENLRFAARLRGQRCSQRQAEEALERFGLRAQLRLPVRALSQGQRKRASLASLFLHQAPRQLLLDEPFDALDAEAVETLKAQIEQLSIRGASVIYTTHQPQSWQYRRPLNLVLPGAFDHGPH